MTCFYCGTELPAGAMFCGECGRPVNTKGGRSPRGAKAAEPGVAQPSVVAVPEPLTEPDAAPAAVVAPDAPPAEPEHAVEVAAAVEPEPVAELAADTPSEPEAGPAAEPVAEAEPEPAADAEPTTVAEAEPETAAEAEPTPEPVVEPEPVAVAEPEPVAVAEPEPVLEPAPLQAAEPSPPVVAAAAPPVERAPATPPPAEPEPVIDLAAVTERCAQCGAPLAASDIFCPECGFVRQRASARPRPSDTNVLDPFPWGLPRSTEPVVVHHHEPEPVVPAASAPLAVPDAQAQAQAFAEVADVSETRLVPRGPRGDRYVLQFSTGESVSVTGTGLIGRNPIGEPGEYFDTLVAIVDPGRSVSKTHLEFGQDGTSFWVSDRYSGNGTVVREPDNEPRRCDAGKRYRVGRGTRVEIGEQFFIVS